MAFAPAPSPSPSKWLGPKAPNFHDFSTPPNGDYARYVEDLMQWAQQAQEQELLRLKAVGDKARSQNDSHWGRTSSSSNAPSSAQPAAAKAPTPSGNAQPGSVDNKVERWARKAKAAAAQLQQQTATASKAPTASATSSGAQGSAAKPLAKIGGLAVLALLAGFVLAGIFVPGLLPVVIIGWVVFNVIRAVRAASSSTKS